MCVMLGLNLAVNHNITTCVSVWTETQNFNNCVSMWYKTNVHILYDNLLFPPLGAATAGNLCRSDILLGNRICHKEAQEGSQLDRNSHYHHLCDPWNCKQGIWDLLHHTSIRPFDKDIIISTSFDTSCTLWRVVASLRLSCKGIRVPTQQTVVFDSFIIDLYFVCVDFRKYFTFCKK